MLGEDAGDWAEAGEDEVRERNGKEESRFREIERKRHKT